jgi:hypothetical protein
MTTTTRTSIIALAFTALAFSQPQASWKITTGGGDSDPQTNAATSYGPLVELDSIDASAVAIRITISVHVVDHAADLTFTTVIPNAGGRTSGYVPVTQLPATYSIKWILFEFIGGTEVPRIHLMPVPSVRYLLTEARGRSL